MIRRVNKGLTIIEVLIVLAVSTSLAVISIGAFSSRGRTQDDDAARQVLADIALVRNQAQQGQGPTTDAGRNNLASGSELFGQAIIFTQDATNMEVKKLAKSSIGIYVYESYTVNNPSSLAWNVSRGDGDTRSDENCDGAFNKTQFLSCYQDPIVAGVGAMMPFRNSANAYVKNIISTGTVVIKPVLVFLNGTGESYIMTDCQPASTACTIGGYNMASYTDIASYAATQQRKFRLGLAKKGSTVPASTKSPQYYINFDLAIPNNQELQVVK
ncbi:MAG: type II secretion system protein [Patescibacteria group bacterium]|nr:type II secretion system protein [Patescibacteria group bacterium]